MANRHNMYGANLKEYTLEVLRNKQEARSTMINWTGVIKNLPLENYQCPPNPTEIYNMVADKYSNPRTKRAVLQTLNCLLGIKIKTSKASFPIHDLPDFEEVSSIIQKPKNKYQARCRMYANLMLHAGLRIGETQYKHQILKNSINVEFQRIFYDNAVQTAKTQGLVVLLDWLLAEYKDWKLDVSAHRTLRDWMWTYFSDGKNGIGFPNLTPHKLHHMYATYYATKFPPSVLQKQLRHSRIETTISYYVNIKDDLILNILNEKPVQLICSNNKHIRAIGYSCCPLLHGL